MPAKSSSTPGWSTPLRGKPKRPCACGEQRFRALIQASAQVVWVTDSDGNLLEESSSWHDFTGQTPDEFRASGWLRAVHPDDREYTHLVWRTAVDAKTRYETTYRLRHRSGEWRYTRARGIPVVNHRGEVDCWVGLNDDITVQHQAEVALAMSELQFRTLAASVPNLIWIADADAQIYYWNDVWYRYTGRTAGDSMGVRAAEAIADEYREGALAAWMRAVRTGRPFDAEFPLRSRTGEYRWFAARASPMRCDRGQIVRWCGSLTDVHDRRRALENLTAERIARERFVCALVHDLKNSFGTSRCAVEQMLDPELSGPERAEFRRVWETSLGRAERMIEDLLDANRLEAGRAHEIKATEWFELRTLVAEAVRSARGRGRVAAHVDPGLCVRWSAPDMVRVLENLLSNAFKYGDAARPVTVEARLGDAGLVLVSVHNWGAPIAPEHQGEVFQFLKRVGGTDVRGWGIGLTLVKGIVEAHGGEVSLESSELAGTRFEVRLPREVRV